MQNKSYIGLVHDIVLVIKEPNPFQKALQPWDLTGARVILRPYLLIQYLRVVGVFFQVHCGS